MDPSTKAKLLGFLRNFVVLAAIVAVLLAPWLTWLAMAPTPLRVLIVDKTVATADAREHRALVWALNHLKVALPGAPPLDAATDYQGFHPRPMRKWTIVPVEAKPGVYDMIYVADTYGVYDAEFYGENRRGERSTLIYGGIEPKEVETVRQGVAPKGTIVGEFNMFASPTKAPGRQAALDLHGLAWDGWIGHWFQDLARDVEVPIWLVDGWERQNPGKPFAFTGPGFGFVHEDGRIVVLKQPDEVGPAGLVVRFADPAAFGVVDGVPYGYWFDVVEAKPGTEVLASYKLDATEAGRAALGRAGIPAEFPAVVRRRTPAVTAYYFAGDYADFPDVPAPFRLRGQGFWMGLVTPDEIARPASFFWHVYLPMVATIIRETAVARGVPPGGAAY